MIKQKLMFNLTTTLMGICNFVWGQRRIKGIRRCFLSQMCLVVKIQPIRLVNTFNVMFLQMTMLANFKDDFSLATNFPIDLGIIFLTCNSDNFISMIAITRKFLTKPIYMHLTLVSMPYICIYFTLLLIHNQCV